MNEDRLPTIEELLATFEISEAPAGYDFDWYRQSRDCELKRIFPDYPDFHSLNLKLSFTINRSNYAYLIYLIMDAVPDDIKAINGPQFDIEIQSEDDFIKYVGKVYELLSIVRGWKTLVLTFNGKNIEIPTLYYLASYLFDKYKLREPYHYYEKKDLKRKYTSGSRKSTKKNYPSTDLSGLSLEESLNVVVEKYIQTYIANCTVKRLIISNKQLFLIVEDSLVLEFFISNGGFNLLINNKKPDEHSYKCIIIQELSVNQLCKVNLAAFKRSLSNKQFFIEYIRFDGVQPYRKDKHCFSYLNKAFPELKLQQRFEAFSGFNYHFIVFEMKTPEGIIVRSVGYTDKKVHSFVLKVCNILIETNTYSLKRNGIRCLEYGGGEFVDAFLEWKGERKVWRLENNLSYYYIDEEVKDQADLWAIAKRIKADAEKGLHSDIERGTYSKPSNRWKTEEIVLNITKKLYGSYQVISQYKPYFLQTERGQLSYDVYIIGLKIAIEYQGKQHFEPVEFFGGNLSYIAQKERDRLKKKLSEENGIRLVYINYWDEITPQVVKQRIEEALILNTNGEEEE